MEKPHAEEPKEFVLPTHCYWCQAYLMGGATKHKPDCFITHLIADYTSGKLVATEEEADGETTQTSN